MTTASVPDRDVRALGIVGAGLMDNRTHLALIHGAVDHAHGDLGHAA